MRLIVTADDYGLTPGICGGILRAHADGIVTSTSVIALGPALKAWSTPLIDSGLDHGAHLSIVGEDPPILTAEEIPTLLDGRGRLPLSWKALLVRLLAGRIDTDDIRREFDAQLARLSSLGFAITNLNTHQHLHLWPSIGDLVIETSKHHGVRAIRVPGSSGRGPTAPALNHLSGRLRRNVGQRGCITTDAFHGLEQAGSWTASSFDAAVATCSSSARFDSTAWAEFNFHPGARDDPERSRYPWRYGWEHELALLCSPHTRSVLGRANLELGDFAAMVAVRPAAHG